VRVAVLRLPGIDSAGVSLERGEAFIRLAADNRLRLDQVRNVVWDNGFTPRAAEVVVAGRIVARDGGLILSTGAELFDLRPPEGTVAEALRRLAGERAVVEGTALETARRTVGPIPLDVREVRSR
jgi:hypothetical protein